MKRKKRVFQMSKNEFKIEEATGIILEGLIYLLYEKLEPETFTDFLNRNKIKHEIKKK